MPTYLVERYVPGMRLDRIREGVSSCRQATSEMRSEGLAIRHVQSLVVIEDELCLCRFIAASADLVEEANRRGDFAYSRISLARAIGPSSAQTSGGTARRSALATRTDRTVAVAADHAGATGLPGLVSAPVASHAPLRRR